MSDTRNEAYDSGFRASRAGKEAGANPYPAGELSAAWLKGWRDYEEHDRGKGEETTFVWTPEPVAEAGGVKRKMTHGSSPIAHEQAREALKRFENMFWKRDGWPRVSIPARPGEDDDLVLHQYIDEQALRTAPAPSAPATDLVVVPREITNEMQRAYFKVIDKNMNRVETDCRFGRHDSNREAYRAMIAAAPTAPAGDGEAEKADAGMQYVSGRAQPPQPTGDVEGLTKSERFTVENCRHAMAHDQIAFDLIPIIDRLNSRFAASAWRDIATAPKDGSCVLLLSKEYTSPADVNGGPYHHPARCAIGRWNPEGHSWCDENGLYTNNPNVNDDSIALHVTGIWLSGGGWFQPNEVTHWMPLPAPALSPTEPAGRE